jgi:hypothetical protein
MERLYECQTCGIISEDRSHVCSPKSLESRVDFCGTILENAKEMCDSMKESRPYHCDNCGRPAEKASMVCSPIRD